MKKAVLVVFMLLAVCSVAFGQTGKVKWSLGYYTTWDNSYSPTTIPWDAFTSVAYFQVEPNTNGTLSLPDSNVAKQLIAAGHSHGKKVVYCIGGEGVTTFTAACATGVRGTLIHNMIQYMLHFGYDGIDTDWEQNFNDQEFLDWHKDLRDSINKLNPVPMLTVAAEDWVSTTLTVGAYVDQENDMYYNASANDYLTKWFPAMTGAGIPKAKCGAGMGISMGNSVQMDTAICSMVIKNGYGGIIQWAITKNDSGPKNMAALVAFVGATSANPVAFGEQRFESPVSLFVNNEGVGTTRQIGYSLPSAANISMVDLVVYDIKGAVVKTLVHGPADHGVFNVPFKTAGAYVVKLSADSRVQATKEVVVR